MRRMAERPSEPRLQPLHPAEHDEEVDILLASASVPGSARVWAWRASGLEGRAHLNRSRGQVTIPAKSARLDAIALRWWDAHEPRLEPWGQAMLHP